MTQPVGVALIGTGRWGRKLAETMLRLDSLRLVTCYSRDEGRRTAFADEFGCAPARSLEAAIHHPGVEAVILATPNTEHADQTLACAAAGKHVFVEKPIAYSIAEAEAMARACDEAGVVLMVGHSFRRLGAAREAGRLVAEGALGQVVLAEGSFSLTTSAAPTDWRGHRSTTPGGPVMQLGIHVIDTLLSWLGGDVVMVRGSFGRVASELDIDDVGVVVADLRRGTRVVVTSSYVSPPTYSIRLSGTRAVLEYDIDMSIWPRADALDDVSRLVLRDRNETRVLKFEHRDMVREELEELAVCVRQGRKPETDARAGIRALAVVLAALESAASAGRA